MLSSPAGNARATNWAAVGRGGLSPRGTEAKLPELPSVPTFVPPVPGKNVDAVPVSGLTIAAAVRRFFGSVSCVSVGTPTVAYGPVAERPSKELTAVAVGRSELAYFTASYARQRSVWSALA
ncbi:MAG: hypothetical protein Q8M65_11325, partial [Rhodoglobus sp.]|nr:hypothetical protein [Rhodoglobus sp.]